MHLLVGHKVWFIRIRKRVHKGIYNISAKVQLRTHLGIKIIMTITLYSGDIYFVKFDLNK